MAEGEQKHRHAVDLAQLDLARKSRELDHRAVTLSLSGGVIVSLAILAAAIYGGIELHVGVFGLALAPFLFLMTQLSPRREDAPTEDL